MRAWSTPTAGTSPTAAVPAASRRRLAPPEARTRGRRGTESASCKLEAKARPLQIRLTNVEPTTSARGHAIAGAGSVQPVGTVLAGHAGGRPATITSTAQRALKRSIDIAASSLRLVVLAPLIAGIALLVRIDSPGPSFFRCDRVGYRGRPLRMLHFRKMRLDAGGLMLPTEDAERFSRL